MKKKYTKPEFHEIKIDLAVSLVMMSGIFPPVEPETTMNTTMNTTEYDPFESPFK